MCLFPKLIKNGRYRPNKKNGGIVPPLSDERALRVSAGCGNCMECRKKKALEWQIRLSEEHRNQKMKGYFVTWTFSDQSLLKLKNILINEGCIYDGWKMENEICRLAVRRYMRRWNQKFKKTLRHWMVTEKGGNNSERIHMHGLVWTDEDKEQIVEKWQYGFCDIGKKGVGEASAGYLVKYMSKVDEKHREYKSRVFCSPGIGRGYLDRWDSKLARKTERYVNRKGQKFSLPMYYRLKLWDDEKREELWMEKLDEDRRFVNGVEIKNFSSEQGTKDYFELLRLAQLKNKRYGYGSREKDWEKESYKRTLKKYKNGEYKR